MSLNTNLVEYWPLTTNNLVGSFGGNTFSQGGGLTWDSTNSCWTVTSATNPYLLCTTITLGTPFTIAVQAYVNGGASGDYTFIGYTTSAGNYWQLYQTGSTNTASAKTRNGGTADEALSAALSGAVYNNTACVYGGATSRQVYLGGTLSSANTTSVTPTGSSKYLTIGSIFDGTTASGNVNTGWRFKNVAVWSRTLTQAELDAYFAAPATVLGPTINNQPSSVTVTAGVTATFTVTATANAGSLTYQWQCSVNSGSSWSNVSTGTGGTTASYTTAAATVTGGSANNGDWYQCVVTDSNGSSTTTAATLTVVVGLKPVVLKNGRLTVMQSGDLIDPAVLPSSSGGTGINARVASTANLTLTAPGPTIDGVIMVSGDMVLVKNQTTGSQNGVYTYNGSASTMTRISGLDSSAEAITGLLVTVAEGTANATTVWMLSTYQPITLNTTSLAFTQISQNGTVIISTDVTVDFGTIPTYAKQFSISLAGLQVGQRVQCVTSGYTPIGVYFDEHEFGVLQWVGKVVTADTLLLLGTSTSPIKGQRICQVTAKVGTSQMFITSGQPTVPDFTLQAANII